MCVQRNCRTNRNVPGLAMHPPHQRNDRATRWGAASTLVAIQFTHPRRVYLCDLYEYVCDFQKNKIFNLHGNLFNRKGNIWIWLDHPVTTLRRHKMKNRFKISVSDPVFTLTRKGHLCASPHPRTGRRQQSWATHLRCRSSILCLFVVQLHTLTRSVAHRQICMFASLCVYYTFKFIFELRKFMFANKPPEWPNQPTDSWWWRRGRRQRRWTIKSICWTTTLCNVTANQDIWFDFQVTYPSLSMSLG